MNNKNKHKRDHADESNKIMKKVLLYPMDHIMGNCQYYYVKEIKSIYAGTDVLGIKDVRQPTDNNNKRIVKWYYCDIL